MRGLQIALTACLLLLCGELGAVTAEQGNSALRSFSVGVERLNYEPFYFNNAKGYQGFARELLDLFQSEARLRLNYVALPVDELKARFYQGELDFKFPDDPDWLPEPQKALTIYYSNPVVSYVDGVCVKPQWQPRPILKIGAPRGFDNPILRSGSKERSIEIIEKDSIESLLQALVDGELDGAWGSMDVLRYKAKKYGEVNLILDLELPHKIGAYTLSTIKHRELLEQFNRFLIRNQEKILEMETKWRIDALRQLRTMQLRRDK